MKQALHFSRRYASEVLDMPDDYVFSPTSPVVCRKQEVVNGQILDVDGEIVDFDPRLNSYKFSDFSVSSLASVGYSPEGDMRITPSPFVVLDSLPNNDDIK